MHDACFCFGKGKPCINICAHKYVYWLAMEMSTNTNEHENNCNYRSIWEKNQRNVCHMKIHVYTCIRILVEHPQPWSGTNQLQPGGGWFVKWKLEISCQWKLLYFWAKNALISPPEFNRFFPKLLLLYCSYFSYRGEGSQILRGGCRTGSCLRRRLMFNWCVGECTQILFWPGKRPWGRALFEVASHVPLVVLGECAQFFFLSRFGGQPVCSMQWCSS